MTFSKNKYKIVRNFLDKGLVAFLQNYTKLFEDRMYKENPITKENPYPYQDETVDKCFSWYGGFHTDSLLMSYRDKVAKIIKKDLVESYSFHRTYYHGSKLIPHIDRKSCEYSVTVCINKENIDWPLYLHTLQNEILSIELNDGDALIYQGTKMQHWRNEYFGKQHTQFFLHYIDKNNIFYPKYMLDGRNSLGTEGIGYGVWNE